MMYISRNNGMASPFMKRPRPHNAERGLRRKTEAPLIDALGVWASHSGRWRIELVVAS